MVFVLIYHEGKLLLSCLEASMTKLGGGVNKFKVNRFLGLACSVHKQGLKHRCHVRNKGRQDVMLEMNQLQGGVVPACS